MWRKKVLQIYQKLQFIVVKCSSNDVGSLLQLFVKNFDKTFETGWAASQKDKIAQHMLNLCTDKGVWKSGRNALSPMFTTARVSGEHFAKIRNQIANMWTHAEEARLQGKPINTKQVCIINTPQFPHPVKISISLKHTYIHKNGS